MISFYYLQLILFLLLNRTFMCRRKSATSSSSSGVGHFEKLFSVFKAIHTGCQTLHLMPGKIMNMNWSHREISVKYIPGTVCMHVVYIFSTLSSVFDVERCPWSLLSSASSQPSMDSLCHSETHLCGITLSLYTSFSSRKHSVGVFSSVLQEILGHCTARFSS